MWDRKVLKEKAKAAFRANRITCIFAAFLLALAGGGVSSGSTFTVNSDTVEKLNIPPETMKIIISVVGVLAVAGLLLAIFVFNPVRVGLKKFFLDNSFDQTTGLSRGNIGVGFSNGDYTNVVAATFTTDLFIFLWTMLFVVPGIIKSYAWRMVPYIIAEDPEITGSEARLKSAEMMYGSKWNCFVLDLSFLGWMFIGALTLGIGNLIWTDPYHAATDAELYRYLKAPEAADDGVSVQVVSERDDTVTFD